MGEVEASGRSGPSCHPKVSQELEKEFQEHVRASCLRPFPPLYFTVGVVEEVAELAQELEQGGHGVVGELGDVLWYVYALCNSLEGVTPCLPSPLELSNNPPAWPPSSSSSSLPPSSLLLASVGQLAGSIKKWSRGDKEWKQFQPRVQKQVMVVDDRVVTEVTVVTSDCSDFSD